MTVPLALPVDFVAVLVDWQRLHGRHHLPWQRDRDPYRVWLSEVMLQQTQVVTVLDYFDRFLARFPTIHDLAAAPQEAVMSLWAGLGYYSRARLLHRCAQAVVGEHGGTFPSTIDALVKLPGIGPSTAAAIASFCYAEPVSIYDGNVKRVLSRLLAYEGDLTHSAENKQLSDQAQRLLTIGIAQHRLSAANTMPAYTQGLMDLGATICHSRAPLCASCPVRAMCAAHKNGTTARYPIKSKKLKRTTERWLWLRLETTDAIWLEQRPQTGIWAGMQAPPLFDTEAALSAWLHAIGISSHRHTAQATGPTIKHVLTHKDLHLTPVTVQLPEPLDVLPSAGREGFWVGKAALHEAPLPAPAKKWLIAGGE